MSTTPSTSSPKTNSQDDVKKRGEGTIPGMTIGPDGKPCKACSGFQAWTKQTKRQIGGAPKQAGKNEEAPMDKVEPGSTSSGRTIVEEHADCPADSHRLGRHTWTLLHTIGSYYPVEKPSQIHQESTLQLIKSLSIIYPCQPCASHLQDYLAKFPPQIENRSKLERWLCEAHNDVNVRLGKEVFDCSSVSKRWRDGWDDGHCD
ncbi:hypothetical protein MJO28_001439 [Puccinia striiformis f. sp. tritici]|uniref:Uncharacterized protein n=1 Tax=Puccinia striiformis f. sp. tritici TaxID=168172 RepID=A0ACC0ETZ5_9BASI|nr:hypothetical protein MJO28_001439 [Puccinia striiformis f. sp. tritici]KAI7965730.1 hypothetical protein MJO29_001478 [Puccinia striiformis f. sp. tritici]